MADNRGYLFHPVEPIVKMAADAFHVSPQRVYGTERLKTVAGARQLAMYLTRIILQYSYPELGRAFQRDHTTVMNACKKVAQRRGSDKRYNAMVEGMLERLRPVEDIPEEEEKKVGTSVVFSEKVWSRLKDLRATGVWGDSIDDVVNRLVSLKLYEMKEPEE